MTKILEGTMSDLAIRYIQAKNHVGRHRTKKISKIVIHHGVTTWNGLAFANYFKTTDRLVNANYVIGDDGAIYCCLKEEYRPWTTGHLVDEESITIEVANTEFKEPWRISDKAMDSLIQLVYDISKRYSLLPITFTNDKSGTLQMHKWYSATSCPGTYLSSKFPYIAEQVNLKDRKNFHRVQTGAYREKYKYLAYELEKKLHKNGFTDTWVFKDVDGLIKVQVGAFRNRGNALGYEKRLQDKGFNTWIP